MNPKKTILLAVIAGLLIFFFIKDKEKVAEEKKKEAETKDFLVAESKDVMKLAVTRKGQTVKAERDGEEWKITEPVAWPGDKYAWNSIADNLASAQIDRTFPDEGKTLSDADLQNWGLKPAGLKIAATIRTGSREVTFDFGHNPPGGKDKVYALSSEKDGKAFMIPQAIVSSASKELRDLRNRKVLDVRFDDKKITRVEVSKKDLNIVAEKGEGENWNLVEPFKARLDSAQLRKMVDKLGNDASNIIDNVSPEEISKLGLAPDQLASATRYKVFTGQNAQTFYIGAFDLKEKGYVGKREGTDSLFVLAKEFFTDQPKHPDELRPKKALSLETWNTDLLSATAEHQLLYSAVKKDGKWRVVAPQDATGERDAIEAILRAFNDNKILGFADGKGSDADLGLDNPRLILKAAGKDKSEIILFGKEEDGKVYAAWQDAPDRFLVDRKLYDAVRKDVLSLVASSEKERVSAALKAAQPAPATSESAAPPPQSPPTEIPAPPPVPATGTSEAAVPPPAPPVDATGTAPAPAVVPPATNSSPAGQ
ncbi:DUF4340 domain-containing protein [bacterium]|nr:hypothetical protein [bacterium]MCK6494761.1 DUF4340 domain-containing protein [bacterium]NUP94054.1 DUF4340 domain-containing protein [Candidatus Omnitrophota bacterium]